jgi:hypothetical protein
VTVTLAQQQALRGNWHCYNGCRLRIHCGVLMLLLLW